MRIERMNPCRQAHLIITGLMNTVRCMKPQAVLFDAYGTLFDVLSVSQRAESLFPGRGAALAEAWRVKQIDYTRLVSMAGPERYQPFSALTRQGLRAAAAQLGLPLDEQAEGTLMAQYERLDPYPENRAVLAELQRRGVPCGILSNGDPPMLEAAVAHAGFAPLLAHVISVHGTRRFKVDPAAYALGPAALGLPAAGILFVSSNAWDALGARWFGYTTLWINRRGGPPEALEPPPHHTGTTLAAVLDFFPDPA